MSTFRDFIKKQAVLAYFILTFVFTWGCMAIVAGPGGFPITEEQFETNGALVYVAMLVGPSAAGILSVSFSAGVKGLRELWSRLTRWRVSIRWYAVALLAAPLLITMVLLALSLISSEFQPAIFTSDSRLALVLSAVTAGLVVGLFEELGWTGFAVPSLKRRFGVVTTGLIVGLIWGAWHFPPFWKTDTFSAPFPLILLLGQLFSWLPPFRILMVWVYERTESLLVTVLMHASLMASLSALVPGELSGTNLLTWILTWAAVLWTVVAVIAIASDRRLSRQALREEAV